MDVFLGWILPCLLIASALYGAVSGILRAKRSPDRRERQRLQAGYVLYAVVALVGLAILIW